MTAAPLAEWMDAERHTDPAFWRARFPDLRINGPEEDFLARPLSNEATVRAAQRMALEGYFRDSDEGLIDLSARLSAAVSRLVEHGIPPVFIFMFDEAWAAFHRQTRMIASFLGPDYQALPDFWAWHVDPRGGEAGWSPHRDRGRISLAPDGSPLLLTVWIPLTAATPETSCMYMLPANKDPNYGGPNETTFKIDPPAVRALPGQPGDWFCWNQAVLHWGSQTSPFGAHPRISLALEFQRGDITPIRPTQLNARPNLTFRQRLVLICAQILNYQHMYPLSDPLRQLALRYAAPIAKA